MDEQTKELIKQMQQGSQAAFDEIYRREAGKLYRLAYLIAGNHSDSEDILQETFVKCFLHCRELKQPEGFEKWMTQILIRTAWRFLKKHKQVISLDEFCEKEEGSGYQEKLLEDTVSPEPLEQILCRESEGQVFQAVKQLNLKVRTVIILYYYQEYSVGDIARITGSLEGTVKSRLYTGRKLLKKQLEHTEIAMEFGRRAPQ